MENRDKFIIQKNDCSNIDELILLTKTYYNEGDIINKRYLEWQYLQNPAGNPFLYVCREEISKELAGQYLVIPTVFNVLNTQISGSLSLNTLTSPKHQGKGLFTKMAKATYEDCANNNSYFTIGFPNPQSYPGFVKKLNFMHLGDIPLLIKPINYHRILLSYFKRNKKKHGGNITLDVKTNNNIHIFNFNDNKLYDKYEIFWNSLKRQYKISIDKNFEYINWRYNIVPTRKYKLLYYEENETIKGIIILKAEHVWGFNIGLIMDLMVLNNDLKIGKKLLNNAKKLFLQKNLDFIAALHTNNYEFNILKKYRFYKIPQKILPQRIHFIVRENKNFTNAKILFDLNNWKLSFGDYDVF